MQAVRYVDWDGPVEIGVYTLAELRDNKGHRVDAEAVQWRWYVSAPNGIHRSGLARGKSHAMREAVEAARKTKTAYDACLALERQETAHV